MAHMVVRWSTLVLCLLPSLTFAEQRREVQDRHGHLLFHLPLLRSEGSCAPDLVALVSKNAANHREAQSPISTVLDGGLQAHAQEAVARGVYRLSRTEEKVTSKETLATLDKLVGRHLIGLVRKRDASALTVEFSDPSLIGEVALQSPSRCHGHDEPRVYGKFDENLPKPGDRVRVLVTHSVEQAGKKKNLQLILQPQVALVTLSTRTRDVLAMVGGYGQRPFSWNRATQNRRQAGSTWKPIVYAAALLAEPRLLSLPVEDLPRGYGGWHPRNFSGTYLGRIYPRQALEQSINTVAVHLLAKVGPSAALRVSERLGIPAAQVPLDLTSALGTAQVSALQMAGAYAVFADTLHGRYLAPRFLTADPSLADAEVKTAALPPQVAYLITSLLQSVVQNGSAQAASVLDQGNLAGKTGTSNRGNDAWFVGYTDELVTAVWVGDDVPGAAAERTGAEAALPIWIDFVKNLGQIGTGRPWPQPEGVAVVPLPPGAPGPNPKAKGPIGGASPGAFKGILGQRAELVWLP